MNSALLTIDDFSSKNTPAMVDYLTVSCLLNICWKTDWFLMSRKFLVKMGRSILLLSDSEFKFRRSFYVKDFSSVFFSKRSN